MPKTVPVIKFKKASKHDGNLVTVSISDLPQAVRDVIATEKGDIVWISVKPVGYRYSRSNYATFDPVVNRKGKTMAAHIDLAELHWPAPDVGRPVKYFLDAINATIRF